MSSMSPPTTTSSRDLHNLTPPSKSHNLDRSNSTSSPSTRRLRLRSNAKTMTNRQLQKNVSRKRNLATHKSATPSQRRKRHQQDHVTPPRPPRDNVNGNESPSNRRRSSSPSVPHGNRDARVSPTHTNSPPAANTAQQINGERNPPASLLTSSDVLAMLKASEQRIIKHFVSQQKLLFGKISDVEALVSEVPKSNAALNSGLSDLKMMVLPSSNGESSQRTSSRSRNQTMAVKLQNEVISANPTLPAECKIIFKTDLVSVAAAKAIASHMIKFHRTREGKSITSRLLYIFAYGLPSGMKLAAFKEGISLRHADFRFKIANIFVELARALPEELFAVEETPYTANEEQERSVRVTKKPSWLTSGLVDVRDMSQARRHKEYVKSDLPPDPTDPQKRKALYIATSIMKLVMEMLRQSREKYKLRVFEAGIYLLENWEGLDCVPTGISNPVLEFFWPEVEEVQATSIPECLVGDLDEVREANNEVLQTVISERKEMLVLAHYDVDVTKSVTIERRRKRKVTQRRRMRRVINILRIAKTFLSAFCHLSEEKLLCSHPTMLQCMYRIALVFREMFMSKIQGVDGHTAAGPTPGSQRRSTDTADENDGRPGAEEGRNGDQQPLRRSPNNPNNTSGATEISNNTTPITLQELVPGESERDRLLTNALKLSDEAYNRLNYSSGRNDTRARRQGTNGHDENDEADSDMSASDKDFSSGNEAMSDMMEDEEYLMTAHSEL